DRIVQGCAGENVLLETDRIWRLEHFERGLAFQSGATGELARLTAVTVADPCVQFSRFSPGHPTAPPQAVKPLLQFFAQGTRGYCLTTTADSVLAAGDRLILLDGSDS